VKIVLTGASRGIGLGAARLLLAKGHQLMGTGKDAARLEAAARELQALGEFHPVVADLARPAEAAAVIKATAEKTWGALDALINNAAIGGVDKSFLEAPASDLGQVLDVNLLAPHHLTKALLPLLEKGREPRVINVSSGSGQFQTLQSFRNDPAYCLSKYSLNALTILWSHTLKGKVAVNSMHPGWIRSDMGGPNAPDDLATGGRRILDALEKPFSETGKFWYGKEEMAW
jgi:NAD(P)-dependent dehydrogenase (short-subunit alcohol dehydrogenase family)